MITSRDFHPNRRKIRYPDPARPWYKNNRQSADLMTRCSPQRLAGCSEVESRNMNDREAMTEGDAMVFVVDDDVLTRKSLQNLFRSVGLRVAVFASAEEFLRRKRPDVPGCLVLDCTCRD